MDNRKSDRREENKSSATHVLYQRRMVQLNMRTGSKKHFSYCLFLVNLNKQSALCQSCPESVFFINSFREQPNLLYQVILKTEKIYSLHLHRMSACRYSKSDRCHDQISVFRYVIHLVDSECPITQLSHLSQMGKDILLTVVDARQCTLSRLMPYQIIGEQCPHRFKITLCQSCIELAHFFCFLFHKSVF